MRSVSLLFAIVGLSLGALLFSSGDVAACGKGKLLFEDDFNSIKPSWDFESEEGRSNGPGGLTYTLAPGTSVGAVNQSGPYTDYELCALFAMEGGAKRVPGFVALRFWFADYDDEYWAVVFTGSGTSVVNHYVNDDVVAATPQIVNPSGVTDAGLSAVSVIVHGKDGSLSVNGKKLGDFSGDPPKQGTRFGFVMRAGKENPGPVAFTLKNIQLRELEQAQP